MSDKVVDLLIDHGIDNAFMVTGGAAMHLNDSITRNKKLKTTFFHHEQSCAIAAEGFFRATGKDILINVTAGPGGINALNGVFGAFNDSVPMFILSGQVRTDTLNRSKNLRQLGDQEAPITEMVKKITKYSKTISNEQEIEFEIKKALKIMSSGRKGPVWIDIPIDIQGKELNQISQKQFKVIKEKDSYTKEINLLSKKINESKRPVVLIGNGIRNANAIKEFEKFISKFNLPVLSAYNGHDILWENHSNYFGRAGTQGDRRGNFILECSDLLLVLGSSLNIRQISYNYKTFGKDKIFCYVDIDKDELNKKTIKNNLDISINLDLKKFFNLINKKDYISNGNHEKFFKWSKKMKNNYSPLNEKYPITKKINPYLFCQDLYRVTYNSDIIVMSNATSAIAPMSALRLKKGQRFFGSSGSGSMGYGLPAAIGASIGKSKNRIICFEGDGSLQMNIQELATVKELDAKIAIIIFSNNGYHSIRQTQQNYFSDNLKGIDSKSGLSFPNLRYIAKAYGLDYIKITKSNYHNFLNNFKDLNLPLLIDIEIDDELEYQPKVKSRQNQFGEIVSSNLYDMYPYLDDEEMKEILSIKNY